MEIATGFLIYVSLFRLVVIVAGVVFVVLGYRLFVRGVMPEGRTDAEVAAGDIRLNLKNAAPGTIFALFGASTIIVMLIQGSPELLMEDIGNLADMPSRVSPGVHSEGSDQVPALPSEPSIAGQVTRRVQLKGPQDDDFNEALQRYGEAFQHGGQLLDAGDVAGAIEAYRRALSESEVPLGTAAAALNQLAWIYRDRNRSEEALALAQIAVGANEQIPEYWDTLAHILLDLGEQAEALEAAEKAVALKPHGEVFRQTLARVRAAGLGQGPDED